MGKILLLSSFLMLACFSIFCQKTKFDDSTLLDDFENLKKQFDNELNTFKEKSDNEMAEFKSEADREFAGYLKNKWFRYNLNKADSFFTTEPVKQAPSYKKQEIVYEQKKSSATKNSVEKQENKVALNTAVSINRSNATAFSFYGNSIIISFDDGLLPNITYPIDENSISKCWTEIVKSNYENAVKQLITYKINLSLNDFAYLKLIREFSKRVNQNNNNANLLSWVLLNKSGYKAKIGYDKNICLLIPFRQMIYNNTYLIVENEKYYLLDKAGANLQTYVKEDKAASLQMDLNISNNMHFGDDNVEREINCGPQLISLKVKINKNLIDFYADYPQTDIGVYFDAVVNETILKQLNTYFNPLLKDKNELDAINIILSFCQKLTSYKEDFESFGQEKFMFAEESFYYPYSDCEDRTILFAKLLYELTGKYVIGLQYKGHMAGAVEVNPAITKGSYIDNKYLMCDPTYIGAPVGLIIPDYENQTPVIVMPDTNLVSESKRLQIIDFLTNHDIKITDNRNSLFFDKSGNSYFIGSFKENLKLGRYNFKTKNDSSNVIIGKLDKKKNVIWCNQISGNGNLLGCCILQSNTSDLFIAFSYSDTIKLGNSTVTTQSRDYCLAKLNANGSYIWSVPLNVKHYNLSASDYFQCSITNDGKINWAKPENNALIEQKYSLYSSDDAIIFMAPSDKVNFESNILNFSSFDLFELPGQILSEYQRLIKLNFDSAAATIYTIGNLMQKDGSIMSGRAFQAAINKNNPEFKVKNPLFYNALNNILFMRNNKNKIAMCTKGQQKITFNKLIIEDGAIFTINFLPNGNLKIDIDKGIKTNIFDLNYAVVSKKDGTIILDFSKEHQQKSLKIKPEIVE